MKRIMAFCLLSCITALFAESVLHQNFEDAALFRVTGQPATVGAENTTDGIWTGFNGQDFKIVEGASKSGDKQALSLARVGIATLTGTGRTELKDDSDTTLRIAVKPGPTGKSNFGFNLLNSAQGTKVAQIQFTEDNCILSVAGGHGNFMGRSRPNEWLVLSITIHPGAEKLDAQIEYADGAKANCVPAPMENCMPFNSIQFFNYPNSPDAMLIDDIDIIQGDKKSVACRENVALSALDSKAVVMDDKGQRDAPRLIDGDCSGAAIELLSGLPATVEIKFGEPRSISTVRILSGMALYRNNPSTDLSLTGCKIECLSSASGGWREVASATEGAPVAVNPDEDDKARAWQFDFEPLEAKAVRVILTASTDKLQRAGGAVERPQVILREIEAYDKDFGKASVGLASVLEAEFRLQVYRYQKTAQLYAILDKNRPSFEIEISAKERWNGDVPAKPFRARVNSGENVIPIDIADWPNGEYRMLLRAAGKDAPVRGEFARLLRIDRIPAAVPPKVFGDMSGKRMYFPDDWYFEKHSGLKFQQFKPEIHYLDLPRVSDSSAFVKLGSTMYFTTDGKLVMAFGEYSYDWKYLGRHYVTCTPGKWDWTISDKEPENIAATNNAEMVPLECRPAVVSLPGDSVGSMGKFRFYDAENDGPVDLSQVVVQYVGYKPVDWGIIKVPAQTTWLIWKKDDVNILLQDHYFLRDNISGGEFEALTDTNDNHAGQWLSEDGKTLYFARGHLLRRYSPFIARYDNLWQASRILTVFSTRDGLNWERHYFSLPDEADPPNMQHYGAAIYHAPRGNGLMVAMMYPYNAMTQQYDVELTWSWDCVEWNRFPGHERWLKVGEPDQPSFGITNMHNNIVEKDGMIYHEIGWATPVPHFAGDNIYCDHGGKLTVEEVRKLNEKRGVSTEWPFWSHYGSWEKLTETWNKVTTTFGVAVYRKGGLLGVAIGNDGGSFTSRPMTAKGKLVANIRVNKGGKARFALLDNGGNEIAVKDVEGDGIALPLFDKLPDGEFRICAELKNAELFTLNFD